MAKYVKLADINYVGIVQAPILFIAEEWATARPEYHSLVSAMPDGTLAFSLGFAAATLFYDVFFRSGSRIRQAWHWLVDRFEVEWIHAGSTGSTGEIELVAMLRFRRRIRRGKLWLRVHNCTHQGRDPIERLSLVEELADVPSGYKKRLVIATHARPLPGWDHTKQRGWLGGPETIIGNSSNVVSIELPGLFLTQTYKMFVELGCHIGDEHTPHLIVVSEDDSLLDHSKGGERMTRRVK